MCLKCKSPGTSGADGGLRLRPNTRQSLSVDIVSTTFLHLLISVFTLGLWVIVWLLVAITGGERRKTIRAGDWAEPSEEPDDQIWQWVTENSVKVRDALRKRNG